MNLTLFFTSSIRKYFFIILIIGLTLHILNAKPSSDNIFTQEEIDWLENNQSKLNLWFETGFPPIEFSSYTGKFTGFGADIVDIIEKKANIKFQKTPSESWVSQLEGLKSGECAVVPTIIKTEEREEYIFFSKSYLTVPLVLISKNDYPSNLSLSDLSSKKIGVIQNYATEKYLKERKIVYNYNIVNYNSVRNALTDLSFGQIDVFFENYAVVAYYIQQEKISNLKVAGYIDYTYSFHMGISKKYPLLYSIVEKTINSISEEEIDNISKKWFNLDQRISEKTILLIKFSVAFLILLVMSLSVFSYILKRRLTKHTQSLRESEEKYRNLTENMSDMSWFCDLELNTSYVSSSVYKILGFTPDEYLEKQINSCYTAESLTKIKSIVNEQLNLEKNSTVDRNRSVILEVQQFNSNNEPIWVSINASFARNNKGKPIGIQGVTRDINKIKIAEMEQKKLAEQLAHSQKMEYIGNLAGGIAHDFNNMLGVIIGFTDLTLNKMNSNDKIYSNIIEIKKAAKRSSILTKQLLTFARKQVIEPELVNINNLISGMLKMLKQIVGEEISIEFTPNIKTWNIMIDPSQIEQIIVNLCLNARDSFQKDGKIIIEAINMDLPHPVVYENFSIAPGEYVRITVSDNGSGMSKEVQSHIFEPFFTTKEQNRGTGLGLATIYGAVKQNNGYITVYSEEGYGTSFHMYFSRYLADKREEKRISNSTVSIKKGNEKILLVDDEKSMLNMSKMMLESLGYNVIALNDPRTVISLANEYLCTIDLLITDIVMPYQTGQELYNKLKKYKHDLKVIYISGHPKSIIAYQTYLGADAQFVQKPFTTCELANKVRAVLDNNINQISI
ncbi:MAG: transporter substrate-binding domain-containing protein [Candidatus Cloacimonetes bacterium]|nr:transporter substrate-binding domain-containing protein [Candidatus Cloacimonadota bacterium]MDD3501932.1 transporter substrate-binding domain-containing protein [Candidatus Cloacimonadota bacterium]